MNTDDREVEVKFYVRRLEPVARRLEELGAERAIERLHEQNLRFDTPDGELTRAHRVLRLRQDRQAVLTYKGPARPGESVSDRQEIEVTVGDLAAARRILEALGFRVSVVYEKFRTTYRWNNLEIVLDEMPFGHFLEIEGPDAAAIRHLATLLGLDWSVRSTASYMELFDRLKAARALDAPHLTFAQLAGLTIEPADLGLQPADR
ncbi:MAG TPA: class IV adenylate cyclase [Anaerolineaceae bacterium]|nr:class IV adenylate cyclase [Anaerolineaceae bacterium]